MDAHAAVSKQRLMLLWRTSNTFGRRLSLHLLLFYDLMEFVFQQRLQSGAVSYLITLCDFLLKGSLKFSMIAACKKQLCCGAVQKRLGKAYFNTPTENSSKAKVRWKRETQKQIVGKQKGVYCDLLACKSVLDNLFLLHFLWVNLYYNSANVI